MATTYNVRSILTDYPNDFPAEKKAIRSILAGRVNSSATIDNDQFAALVQDVEGLYLMYNREMSSTMQSPAFQEKLLFVAMWANTCH